MGNQTSSDSSSTSAPALRLSNITAVTGPSSEIFENKEDVTLIWLDQTIDITRTTLREITNYVRLYTELEPCIAYIRSIRHERIFLIVSGGYAQACLTEVHDLPQVDSIFVFCMNLVKYRAELLHDQRYGKIVDLFDHEEALLQSIREELNDLHQQLATFSLYEKQKSTRDLSKESASFLWFQLFKDVLLRMPRSEEAKRELIDQCRQFYRGNTEELSNIDEFAHTYTDADTIHWYTKQCFLYRLCNKALRTEDIELLYTFRYFIQDLCKRLAIEHEAWLTREPAAAPTLTLYRGLKVGKEELTRFQSNIGALISTNGFLSTTRNKQLALQFALKSSKRTVDVSPVLFIIQVDRSLKDVIYADISSLSAFPDEEEVLFDLGCAFKITEVAFDSTENIWIIRMSSTTEARDIVETYIEENRRDMEKGNVLLIFGLLLTEMGQYHQAQIYFENLLASHTVDDEASLYTNIGRVKFLKGQYHHALKDFKTVYDIQRKARPINYLDFARTMNNLGLIYMELKKYDLALDYHLDVKKTYEKHSDIDERLLASSYDSIGVVLTHKHDYKHALNYLLRATMLYEKNLPTTDHPSMATNYNGIGLVYYYNQEYQQALDYCSKALNIRKKILPLNHPHLADSYNNLALIYHQLRDYEQALRLFQLSLAIFETHVDEKMRIPVCWSNMALLYLDQQQYDQAIEYYLRAWHAYKNMNHHQDKYHEEISLTLTNLAVAYEMKHDLERALDYNSQALTFQQESSDQFVRTLAKIGYLHQKQGKNDLALTFYQKALSQSEKSPPELVSSLLMPMAIIHHEQHQFQLALDIYHRILALREHLSSSGDTLDLAWAYNNLGCLYDDLADTERALQYQEKAFAIRRKLLPANHPDLATSLNNLGRIQQNIAQHGLGRNPSAFAQALGHFQAALHIRQTSLPSDHPDLANSYYNLALIHANLNDYRQAHKEALKALEIQKQILPSHHPDLDQTLKLDEELRTILDSSHHHANLP